jgi:hypothetical protein
MSKRYFRASGGIKEEDSAGLDGVAEVGIPDGAGLDQVNGSSEERREILLQTEEVVCALARRHCLELHQEIDITPPGIERLPHRRPEDRELPNVVAFAENSDLVLSLTQQVLHGADYRPVGTYRLR